MLIVIVGNIHSGKTTFREKLLAKNIPEYNPQLPTFVMHQNWKWNYSTRRIVQHITLINKNLIIECADTTYVPKELWSSINYWIFLDNNGAEEYFKRSFQFTSNINRALEGTFGVWLLIGDENTGEWVCKCSYNRPCLIYDNIKKNIVKMFDCTITQ